MQYTKIATVHFGEQNIEVGTRNGQNLTDAITQALQKLCTSENGQCDNGQQGFSSQYAIGKNGPILEDGNLNVEVKASTYTTVDQRDGKQNLSLECTRELFLSYMTSLKFQHWLTTSLEI